MLRVSSLGLLWYHDALPSTSLFLHRHLSTARLSVPDISERTPSHGEDNSTHDNSTGVDNEKQLSVSPKTNTGRRHPLIPPIQTTKKGSTTNSSRTQEHLVVAPVSRAIASYLSAGTSRSLDVSMGLSKLTYPELSTNILQHEGTSIVNQDFGKGREYFEEILANTSSASEAWDAYQRLMEFPRPATNALVVHYALLHRLARLLMSVRPRTRSLFLRLLSVLTSLYTSGGRVHKWEWNALIDCAGKGWRKTRIEDFQAALDVYNDMVSRKAPGAAFNCNQHDLACHDYGLDESSVPQPDIFTYTTLLHIAGRTLNIAALRHATNMLESSGIPRNRITHLVLVRYFTRKGDLLGVRASLLRMRQDGHELGLDGINACVWAYARNGRIDIAALLYRVLRHNLIPEDELGAYEIETAIEQLATTEGLVVPRHLKPDATMYYALIQCYAYHGDLVQALRIFSDMITTNEQERFMQSDLDAVDPSWTDRSPTLPAFRSIFLGFARHGGRTAQRFQDAGPLTRQLTSSAWTMDNLDALFTSFIRLPHEARPSDRTIYWLLMAYDKLSGHANWKLRRIWEQLEERFGGGWGGRLERFKTRIYDSSETKKE